LQAAQEQITSSQAELEAAVEEARREAQQQRMDLVQRMELELVAAEARRAAEQQRMDLVPREELEAAQQANEAQIQELTASRDQANVSLQAMEAQIQDLTARQATLQEANAQLQAAGEGGYQQRAERQRQATLASCQSHFIPRELAPSIVEARDSFCSEIEEATNENLRSEISIRGCYGHNGTLSAGDYTKP
jgi:hypothetical protein